VIVKRFFDPRLAQTSYLIACGKEQVAIVIDPLRDTDQYVRAAAAEHVRITHVTETHIHADFLSGARDLARITGAQLLLSDEGDADWKYAYAKGDGARLVKDGDSVMIGNVRIQVVHTPGHTPEHISFLVTDTAAADEPIGIVTGDFVFVGDVGRPDLLERAAKVAGSMEASARTLYRSLQKFKQYPDWLQVWPGHGAGSACGKGMSAVPQSTVGYEKRFNWALSVSDEDTFVKSVLEGQPEPPTYFAMMKRMNKEGPAKYELRDPRPGTRAELDRALEEGAPVIDTRRREDFAAGHVRGTVSIPLIKSFTNWAGWLLPYDRDVFLIADGAQAREAVRELAMIGIDRVAAVFDPAIVTSSKDLLTIDQITAAQLAERVKSNGVAVIDVRAQSEWDAGHLPGAQHIHLGHLMSRLGEVPQDKPIVLQCQGGGRSSIAASLLQAAGRYEVANLEGGFEAWEAAGLPVETPSAG
jgi:hydroxyacylglutathione hydrolase